MQPIHCSSSATRSTTSGPGSPLRLSSDGSDQPYRLSIVSNQTGNHGKFTLDTSQADMSFDQISEAQDALLAVGYTSSSNKTMLVSSTTNSFTNVLNGATLTIQSVSNTPVTVTVGSDTTNLATQIKAFVNTYNTFRQTLTTDTAFDTSTNKASVLTGDYSAMQVETQLAKLVSGSFTSGNTVNSLAQLGIASTTTDR